MTKYDVSVIIQVSAETRQEAMDKTDKMLQHDLGYFLEDADWEVVDADEADDEDQE